jgi:hypothetical protein
MAFNNIFMIGGRFMEDNENENADLILYLLVLISILLDEEEDN